jgi:Family of unknown function (DUF5763)
MTEEKKVYDYGECVACFEPLGTANTLIFPCFHKCLHVTCFVKSIDATGSAMCPICRLNILERESSPTSLRRTARLIPTLIYDILNRISPRVEVIVNDEGGIIDIERPPEPVPVQRERRQRGVQCQGIRVDGNRCKRKTKEENGYCYTHQDQYVSVI